MNLGSTLPKELSLALNFRRLTLRFTHRLFDEFMHGHLGIVSQFVLLELHAGSVLSHVVEVFPFDITAIIERLRLFSLIHEGHLTELGKHYAFCLKAIHGKDFEVWAHWGRSLKIILPMETQILTDESSCLDDSLKINAYDNRQRPFAFSRQEHIYRLLGFLVPEYTTASQAEKSADTWQVYASFVQTDRNELDDNYDPEEKYCVFALPEGVDISHKTGSIIPLFLPSLVIKTVYQQPVGDVYFPSEIIPPPAVQTEICLLTGERVCDSDSNPVQDSYPALGWPKSAWKKEISQFLLQEAASYSIFSRTVSMHTHLRSRNISSASVLSAFAYNFSNRKSWTPDYINDGDEDVS
ncbi:hypothetical protein [Desulfovibrio sp.]|uniref:hypothetical protein n=1 Tax=Desulfovibrio sp. TaxID=885 RepID=UPI0025BAAC49|nr:hypothetical protein [Desulfovibrio sp.]